MKKKNRKHSVIDNLSESLKDTVEQMLLTGSTYSEIVDFLGSNEVKLSAASVCRYAQGFHANLQMLSMAQENFRRMMDEINKYPSLDTSEAIIRIASQNVFNALAQAPQEKWDEVDIDALLRQSNGLIRAAAYKNRLDIQNKNDYETGFEAVKTMVFEALAREQPDLYKQVATFLTEKQQAD
ncbi:MAG: phage protein Gp27 family protein [Oscillospiraceae bacterium]